MEKWLNTAQEMARMVGNRLRISALFLKYFGWKVIKVSYNIDIFALQSRKESFVKMYLRSNGKMAENDSGNGHNGGKIYEDW